MIRSDRRLTGCLSTLSQRTDTTHPFISSRLPSSNILSNELITPPALRVLMGSADHPVSGGSHAHLPSKCYEIYKSVITL
ncbi:hypothetical protein EVAR_32227_1 [Eumeta japonica]|uniref:Uncharacterized protein n=1 Tax=Eumeta variegata TaxID=151549 RepID=A0A4C1YIH0_EUMVA|nr:hypothetical protein EVAR_32227_1 [Eumeta japonica]